jgi:hypothetical protein
MANSETNAGVGQAGSVGQCVGATAIENYRDLPLVATTGGPDQAAHARS